MHREWGIVAFEDRVVMRTSHDSDATLMRVKVPLPRAPKSRMISQLSEEEEKGGAG